MTLRLTGIDGDTFTGHSTRFAPCSKTKALCISTKEILERGIATWSSATTFEKFQHKEITQDEDEFQSNIFESFSREVLKHSLSISSETWCEISVRSAEIL